MALPGHLATLVNSGDLDALRALTWTHFTKNSVLCVHRTSDKSAVETKEYCGREHVNSFFAHFLDLMPDIVFTLRKSALSSRKQGGAVMFCFSFHGTTLCGLKNGPSRLHPYILADGCPVKKAVGSLTNTVIRNVRRYFYPNEKAAMLEAEREMRAGKALARIRGVMIGKLSFVPLSQANNEPIQVSRFEVTFKVNHLQGAPLPE